MNVRTEGGIAVLELPQKIVLGEGDTELLDAVQKLLDDGQMKLVFNLEKTTFFDSMGLGQLVACSKRAIGKGGSIKIVNANQKVLDLFSLTRLNLVFDMFDSEADAIGSF